MSALPSVIPLVELEKVGRQLNVDVMSAFTIVKEPLVCVFKDSKIIRITPSEKRFWMPSPPTDSPNTVDFICPGYETADRIVLLPGGKDTPAIDDKRLRFLHLLKLAASQIPAQVGKECKSLVNLVEELQNPDSSQFKSFQEKLSHVNVNKKIVFRPDSRELPLFCIAEVDVDGDLETLAMALKKTKNLTDDVNWWRSLYPKEHERCLSGETGLLHGICNITMQEDVIPRLHLHLPRTPLNPSGAALCGRNENWTDIAGYYQSESSRVGQTAVQRGMIALKQLMKNTFCIPRTCHTENWKKERQPAKKIIHHIVWTDGIQQKIEVINGVIGGNKVAKEFETAARWLDEKWRSVFKKPAGAAPSHSTINYYRISETKGRARGECFESIPEDQMFDSILQWFSDLTILNLWSGRAKDWFSFYDLHNCICSAKENSGLVNWAPFFSAAIHGHNLPQSYITRAINQTLNVLQKYGFDAENCDDEESKRQVWQIVDRMSMLKLWLLRQGFNISPSGRMPKPSPSHMLGALSGIFYQHYRAAVKKKATQIPADFFRAHLANLIQNGTAALPAIFRQYFIYTTALGTSSQSWWRQQIRSVISHFEIGITLKPNTDQQKAEFLMGLFTVVCAKGNSKVQPLNTVVDPLGGLMSIYYKVYLLFIEKQHNPNKFLLKYWDMFIDNPKEGIKRIDERFEVYNQKTNNPGYWRHKIAEQKQIIGELPTHLTNTQQVAAIHGFLS